MIRSLVVFGMVASTAVLVGANPARASSSERSTASSSGCGMARSPGTSSITVRSRGPDRTVIVHVPRGYAASRPSALVLNLHGSGSTAAGQEAFSGMDATSDADGFLVAYPQAAIASGTGFDWNVPGQPLIGGSSVPSGAADDVSFLTSLVSTLSSRYCVNRDRVDATGFSGGARMASQLACDASTTFAAVAPVSGLRYPSPCATRRAVPVLAFHGDADPVDPYAGNGQAYWTYSVPEAARRWAGHDGCRSTPVTTPATGATVIAYSGCRDGAAVQLSTVQGEGHEWPGGPPMPKALTRLLGPQSNAVDANALMWSFFSAHPAVNP
jgi:polyhydroxybutyrate depolymerase